VLLLVRKVLHGRYEHATMVALLTATILAFIRCGWSRSPGNGAQGCVVRLLLLVGAHRVLALAGRHDDLTIGPALVFSLRSLSKTAAVTLPAVLLLIDMCS